MQEQQEEYDARLSAILTHWYSIHKRDLPWRDINDAYTIWLSEVILQQTKVDQGINYFRRFVQQLPTVGQLAAASEEEVLKLWQGLGYYSRARNLHAASKMIVEQYAGVFPSQYADILSLKGVGEYTAAAIASFAYNAPYAVVDGNVYRVLARIFGIDTPIDTGKGKKVFAELAQLLLNKKEPALHNQAIMEFGALQCVPTSPHCMQCPASDMCVAYTQQKVTAYPIKQGKTKVRNRYFSYLDIRWGDSMCLHKRSEKDIWQNLYELPLIETDKALSLDELSQTTAFKALLGEGNRLQITLVLDTKHVLSHQIIHALFYRIVLGEKPQNSELEIKIADVDTYPVARLTQKYLEC